MIFQSKVAASVLAVLIGSITAAFLSLIRETPVAAILTAFFIASAASFLFFYLTLEFVIFRQINRIYKLIGKIRNKEKELDVRKTFSNPIQRIYQDISSYTLRKQQEINELKRLESFRREFLADLSHELKTPVFAAQGFILTLLDGAIDDPNVRDKFLKKAAKSLDDLNVLVQDLITITQMETGEIKMQPEDFDIIRLTQDVFDKLERKAIKKQVTLKIQNKLEHDAYVKADAYRINQVITNLVENAIKYGYEGGKVIVSFTPAGKQIQIKVKDNGPGIPEEYQKRIFERFFRIDKSRSRETGGTGLGLSIVKHIMEGHGELISVSSKAGKGTKFSFKLTRARL